MDIKKLQIKEWLKDNFLIIFNYKQMIHMDKQNHKIVSEL